MSEANVTPGLKPQLHCPVGAFKEKNFKRAHSLAVMTPPLQGGCRRFESAWAHTMNLKLRTEVRVGNYEGKLEELVKRYSNEIIPVLGSNAQLQKYALIKVEETGLYIIMISKGSEQNSDYNIMASVTGTEKEKTQQLMQELQIKMGIKLRAAPYWLEKRAEDIMTTVTANINRVDPQNN